MKTKFYSEIEKIEKENQLEPYSSIKNAIRIAAKQNKRHVIVNLDGETAPAIRKELGEEFHIKNVMHCLYEIDW